MVFKGFSFGMLLQIAVGPVCVLVITIALAEGFRAAFGAVIAVTLVDILFVTLAILGVGVLIRGPRVEQFMKWFSAVVIVYFGLGILLSSFHITIIPGFNLKQVTTTGTSAFITAAVMTIANPLTIVFWAGVFATRISDETSGRRNIILFGIGAVLSTIVFLTAVALVFSLFHPVMTPDAAKWLNIAAGSILIGFGAFILLKK